MGKWREAWIGWRNAQLADPNLQSRLAAFPLTRPMVRRKATQTFDMVTGFIHSQVLLACVELDVFGTMQAGPMTASALGNAVDLPEPAALRLLKAAESLGFTESLGDGRYALGELGAAMLGNPGAQAMIQHHRILYRDMADPVALLRAGRGELADYWAYAHANPDSVADYSKLMAASQPMVAEQVLAAYDFSKHRHLLDVGGGEGAFLEAVGAAHPSLQRSLFDLPSVVERAKARLGDGVGIHGGSFLHDPLPQGADIVSLVRILHDHDDLAVRDIINAASVALRKGGTLLIAEPLADTPGAKPMGEAYFGMYLWAMGQGRPRTREEIKLMLWGADFKDVRFVPTRLPLIAQVITARRKAARD